MGDTEHQFDDEELVSSNATQRNWRGIFIALLVIIVVLALIVTSVVLLTPPDEGPRIRGKRFQLNDILGHEYAALRFNGTWISGEELIFRDQWGGISLLHAANLTTKIIMTNQTFKRFNAARFSLSPDRKFILLAHNLHKLFRYSFLAQYTIYDIVTMDTQIVTPTPNEEGHPYLLYAEWAPRGHSLVMVYNYDIYFTPSPKERQCYRVTNSAIPGVISNGVPDWLYEEEVLGSNTALWMSHDGHMILYATFNDSQVEEQRFPWFSMQDDVRIYPEIRSLRYPKPGTHNPTVSLWVADLADFKNIRFRDLKPPVLFKNTNEFYFTAVTWISLTEVSVIWMNRPQNISIVTICKSPMWYCQETSRMEGEGRGWVDIVDAPLFSGDGTAYIMAAPVRESMKGYYRHIIYVSIPEKRTLPLTHGKFDVTRIVAWDKYENNVYFLAVPDHHPSQLHLYRTASDTPSMGIALISPECLTCKLKEFPESHIPTYYRNNPNKASDDWEDEESDHVSATTSSLPRAGKKGVGEFHTHTTMDILSQPCQYHNAVFSPNQVYFVLECLGPGMPSVHLYTTRGSIPRLLSVLQNNTNLYEKVSQMALPQMRMFQVHISGGYYAQVKLHLPPGLRDQEITQYPLVVQVYSGPGTQLVTDRWKLDWNTYLSSNKDFIVAQIDGRGSSGQGYQLLHEVYMRLGTVEVQDQLEVTEYLRNTLHFVDKKKIAVWGWSYGGFVAAMALSSESDVFKCGISVAPVTSWKLYDSAYTERYMGLPNVTANYKGYEEADVSKRVKFLRNKMFYLVHGTADDNVHFQQSMALAKALAAEGILFRQQIYPDENHNLVGVKRHLYRSMVNFLDDCFRKEGPPEVKAGLRNGGSSGE